MVIDLINWAGTSLISCWAFIFRDTRFFIKVQMPTEFTHIAGMGFIIFTEQAVFNLTLLAFSILEYFVNRAWAGHEGCIAFTLGHTVFLIVA